MPIIDTFAGNVATLFSSVLTSASGSTTTNNIFFNNASGSLNLVSGSLVDVETRFEVINTFSGSGQVDFNNIPQDYTHLFIFGIASVAYPGHFADIGIDFNGSTSGSMYDSSKWGNSGSYITSAGVITSSSYVETMNAYSGSHMIVGSTSGSWNSNYGGPVCIIIPNYTSGSGFYKTAMGFNAMAIVSSHIILIGESLFNLVQPHQSAGLEGGVWKDTAPITRVRIFGCSGSSTKYNLIAGSSFTLYGID